MAVELDTSRYRPDAQGVSCGFEMLGSGGEQLHTLAPCGEWVARHLYELVVERGRIVFERADEAMQLGVGPFAGSRCDHGGHGRP